MEYNFHARLRDEINNGIQRRHDFSLRKLSFCTALLGLGTVQIPFGSDKMLNLTSLLFLVPLVAIAFDLYIVSDDFRVKRVGAFLKKEKWTSCLAEREWEKFVKEHDNKFAPFAFFIVTVILMGGATILLVKTYQNLCFVKSWFGLLLALDIGLLIYSLRIRSNLDKEKKNDNPNCQVK